MNFSLSELAKSYTDVGLSALADVYIICSSNTARIAAASSILDSGYGKPKVDQKEVVERPLRNMQAE